MNEDKALKRLSHNLDDAEHQIAELEEIVASVNATVAKDAEVQSLRADNDRLRAVLEKIANPQNGDLYHSKQIAREALK